ncbi:cytochrome c maturation protein CcmE [Ketobacter sp. MCCC 1A13808]|uniref:cytochrome c maturation protein CcmE n=1 Tax=Ketobacter sp. MCCC 1A13808 TaxID=2602738 RepID=UPI000F240073|nr:cytochrome c maturation protein CcmE [Ketobacter sp. MCCC 1A13808]MVF10878.1 cytochrome c maturation protein CcmE [Ketobacter sp. MCCC 1A13808]RLP56275.1 MAG: cytochrome c maturation protein CcmE [Ketobacter sp.]
MNPIRKQRLIIIVGVLIAVALSVALIMFAMKENINLFYSPTEVVAGNAPMERRIRVGGLVVTGSVIRGEDLHVSFDITDNAETITVKYAGILPDLFREGQGIIANGKLISANTVMADEVLAKHDEKYVPPEVQEAIEKAGHPKGADAQGVTKPAY